MSAPEAFLDGRVALRMGRRAALVELNPEYAAMVRARIEGEWMGAAARAGRCPCLGRRRSDAFPIR